MNTNKSCHTWGGAIQSKKAAAIAVVVVLIIVVAYFATKWFRRTKDKFASQRAHEVYDKSKTVFEKTKGKATFSEYKTAVPEAEVVLYTDARNLWKKGELSPERVQEVL